MTTPTVQPVYATPQPLTNAIASLGSSGTFTAGYESATFDNTSTLYAGVLISGLVKVGTTPTAGTKILIFVVAAIDPSAPTWPDVFDGTTGAETLTSEGIGHGFMRFAAEIDVDSTTSDVVYPWGPVPVEDLFGGNVPQKFVLFTAQNTGANLNASGHSTITQGINYAMPSV